MSQYLSWLFLHFQVLYCLFVFAWFNFSSISFCSSWNLAFVFFFVCFVTWCASIFNRLNHLALCCSSLISLYNRRHNCISFIFSSTHLFQLKLFFILRNSLRNKSIIYYVVKKESFIFFFKVQSRVQFIIWSLRYWDN